MDAEQCAERLKWFAENSCRGQSPLYEHLCANMAEDDRLFEIVRATPDGQPIPNLILAAVHFLLPSDVEDELTNAQTAIVYYERTGQSPLSKWQTHLFEYQTTK
ncbi:MAG: DUF2332 family protein [Planctomycetes bacterium]|nr:DUF2332 family protein [Planctomycetota bacterium]